LILPRKGKQRRPARTRGSWRSARGARFPLWISFAKPKDAQVYEQMRRSMQKSHTPTQFFAMACALFAPIS
jgi:hypothetical protein